jgi:FkbM family methyltransferase
MSSIYHPTGFWNALLRRPAWHLREYWRNSNYRAFHRYASQLSGLERHIPAVVSYKGLRIELCDAASFLSAWDEIFVNRIYEIPRPTGRVPVLVDAGANIGLAALYWKIKYNDFDYVGFEPDPMIAACCRLNLAAWGIRGTMHEVALSDENGEGSFLGDGADGGRLIEGSETGHKVRTSLLSNMLPESVDLLKLDVEGAEAMVLRDIAPCLPRVRNLFMEWHYRTGEGGLGAAIQLLEEAGFDCHVQVAKGQKQPFMGICEEGAFSQNLNIYAVRK